MYKLIIFSNTFVCKFSKLYMSTIKRASKPRNYIIAPSKTYLLMPDLGHWTQLNFCIRIKSTSLKFISTKIVLLIRPASIKIWKCIMPLKSFWRTWIRTLLINVKGKFNEKCGRSLNFIFTKITFHLLGSSFCDAYHENVSRLWFFIRSIC